MSLLKKIEVLSLSALMLLLFNVTQAQQTNNRALLKPLRLPLPDNKQKIEYIDIDNDGDPDILRYTINDTIPVQWIDDDDDMKQGDLSGDLDSDCLMLDLNNDGKYGAGYDLIVDWDDENGDGIADIQAVLENSATNYRGKWMSHYMYIINNDNSGVFNYIDWEKYKVEGWEKMQRCNFMSNYHGNSLMLKSHISSFEIKDIRYNWENPFLFYDIDNDDNPEMAIRLLDEPENISKRKEKYSFEFTKKISMAQITIDLDNDNAPDHEFDFDISLKFYGPGFDYSDQIHTFKSLKGLKGTEKYFFDPRFRQNNELVYCDHKSAYPSIFKGDWEGCWLVFDEDDDCNRWERVEFYEPLDPYKIGAGKGGLDNNPQSDVSGDRGEWDEDFSGQGNLYISSLDNKIHLLGAEYGYWRVDQFADYYQGWQGWRDGNTIQPEAVMPKEPFKAPIIRYRDTDNDGFFDEMAFDMDADKHFEDTISMAELGISDVSKIYKTKNLSYKDFNKMFITVSEENWQEALNALKLLKSFGIDTSWYNVLLRTHSLQEKYNNGFWISYYCYQDLKQYCKENNDTGLLLKIKKAFVENNWKNLKN